ncbi:MAG: hypothetical protein KatS3mg124_0494 [Porticoccaceae bacterium]|nr:MAG: hypothetical protein KatS3mg124_0494 [Porticoccaceae bacterium]
MTGLALATFLAVPLFAAAWAASSVLAARLAQSPLLDRPGPRSAHRIPVPRGGGIGFVPLLCAAVATWGLILGEREAVALAAATAAMALLGFADDRWRLPVAPRLAGQILLASALLAVLSAEGAMPIFWFWGLPALVWCTNLYNFMDGADGLAAQQALLAGLLLAALATAGAAVATAGPALCAAAAAAGFLTVNRPPARLFMGDAGSLALGFACGGLALLEAVQGGVGAWLWAIALASFAADASATLLVRVLRGQSPFAAHREHAYQHFMTRVEARAAARGWDPEAARSRAHRALLALHGALFLGWQTPWAAAVAAGAVAGGTGFAWCAGGLALLALAGGAGRPVQAP